MCKEIHYQNEAIIGISKVQQRFDGIASFVVNTILSIKKHSDRRRMYVFFLDLASVCCAKNDYYNARAINSGLENICIERTLRISIDGGVPPDHLNSEQLRKRERLLTLFDLRHNLINLRNEQLEFKKVPSFIADLTLVSKDLSL